MLYDPKWEVKTTPTLADLIAWLETRPPEQTYSWFQCSNCLAHHFLKARGYTNPVLDAFNLWPDQRGYPGLFGGLARYHAIGSPMPWTYGAALERARKVAASS